MDRRSAPGAVVLFDGVCNLCNGFVQFVIPRDPDAYFRFAALDSEARPMRGRAFEQIDAEVFGDRHAFLFGPGDVGVEQELGVF